jgi:hypothetical protein
MFDVKPNYNPILASRSLAFNDVHYIPPHRIESLEERGQHHRPLRLLRSGALTSSHLDRPRLGIKSAGINIRQIRALHFSVAEKQGRSSAEIALSGVSRGDISLSRIGKRVAGGIRVSDVLLTLTGGLNVHFTPE